MPSKGSEVVDVRYQELKIDNPKYQAVLFKIGGKDVWLPRSQIEIDTDARLVTIPTWLAEKAEIDGEVI